MGMYDTKAYYYGTGRRKHSVARVRVYPGSGTITINGRDIDDYGLHFYPGTTHNLRVSVVDKLLTESGKDSALTP